MDSCENELQSSTVQASELVTVKEEPLDSRKIDVKEEVFSMNVCDAEVQLSTDHFVTVKGEPPGTNIKEETVEIFECISKGQDLVKQEEAEKCFLYENTEEGLGCQKTANFIEQSDPLATSNETVVDMNEMNVRNDNSQLKSVYEDSIQGKDINKSNRSSIPDGDAQIQEMLSGFKCHDCHKVFLQFGELERHIRAVHTKTIKCESICKTLSQKDVFNTQIESVHKRIKKYECIVCHKSLCSAQYLQIHMESVHRGIKKHECNYCHKMFSTISHLTVHIDRVHRKIRKYKCNHCHKVFSEKRDVYKHIYKMHENNYKGNRKYECSLCHKVFSSAQHCSVHIDSVHKRIENQCNYCHKKLSTAQYLRIHIKNVHKGIKKKYECNHCHKMFSTPQYVAVHIDKVHKKS